MKALKKIAAIACLVVLAPCCADCAALIGSGISGAACNPASDYVGSKDHGDTNMYNAASAVRLFKATASCSGELDTAYFYQDATGTGDLKVCVYEDNGDGWPNDSTDTLLGCATISPTGTKQMYSATFPSGNNVTAGSDYFVTMYVSGSFSGEVRPRYNSASTATMWYISGGDSSYFTSPPSDFGSSSFSYNSLYNLLEIYVTIK